MFQAQILMGGNVVYGPWMARGGDYARVTLEQAVSSSCNITVVLFTKKHDDPGNGTAVSGSLAGSGLGRTTAEFPNGANGMNDLVRYQFTASGSGSNYCLFRMLPIVWFDAVV
jgi:hypothetical protein